MRLKNYINGQWVESRSSQVLDVRNPATDEVLAEVPLSTIDEVGEAIKAARDGFEQWRQTPPLTRARYLFRLKDLLEERLEEISRLLVQEHGKTLAEARGEVRRGIENVEVASGIPSLMMGSNMEDIAKGIDCESIRQPIGVFCVIPPFNFPFMVPLWFVPYAIACGNTCIVKPSEQVPLSQNILFQTMHEAGFPRGVVNLVNGAKEAVDALLESDEVNGASFVGSSAVARYVYQKAAVHGKRAQCLGGAKNFLVVMPDADLDTAVDGIIGSAFGCAGERCLAGSIVLPVGDVYEALKAKLVQASSQIKVGNGLDERVDMGPVISRRHRDRVLGYIENGVEEGARLLLDGRKLDGDGLRNGWFVGPTIFDEVRPEMVIANEDIFGPVLGIIKVRDLDEALRIIDANPYGNATAIFTGSGKWAREFKYRVRCGMVGINVGVPAPMSFFTFTGWKGSFFGDLHAHGRDAIEFFTEKKVVTVRWV
ncbi:MAG: CoA-acylating methylmalonate-semialdehyde dehydrogenase [Chloroflexi bacterium]|nr:CoA-acylating methylmalonate-semialdehyde dehydrogenase [Chloroflexota bacterium]